MHNQQMVLVKIMESAIKTYIKKLIFSILLKETRLKKILLLTVIQAKTLSHLR